MKLNQDVEWELEATRHAMLYLVQPKVTQYRYPGRLGEYIYWKTAGDPKARKRFLGMVVVTKICQARSFAKLLTNGEKGRVQCKFLASPSSRAATISGDQAWERSSASGSWRVGDYTPEYIFTPLVELHSLKPNPQCPFVLEFKCKKGTKAIDFEKTYSKVPDNNWAAGSASAAVLADKPGTHFFHKAFKLMFRGSAQVQDQFNSEMHQMKH